MALYTNRISHCPEVEFGLMEVIEPLIEGITEVRSLCRKLRSTVFMFKVHDDSPT